MASRAIFVVDRKAYLNRRLDDIDQYFRHVSLVPFDFDNKLSTLNSSTILFDSSSFVSDEHRSHLFYRSLKYKRAQFKRTYIFYEGSFKYISEFDRMSGFLASIKVNNRKTDLSFQKIIRDVRKDDPNSEVFFLAYTDRIEKIERNIVEKIYDQNVRFAQIKCSAEDMMEDIRTFAHLRMNIKQFSYKSVVQVARIGKARKNNHSASQKYVAPVGLSKWKFDGLGDRSEIWQLDPLNFESKNRGSREDGLQQLHYARMIPAYAEASETILRYFLKCDPAPSVRRAAAQILESGPEIYRKLKSSYIAENEARKIFDLFIKIPSGPFIMGSSLESDPHSLPSEEPAHEVFLEEFYIMKRTLSNGDWQKIGCCKEFEKIDINLPKTELNWFECQSIASFLQESFLHWGLISPEQRVQLPSEAEWEKAARGADGRLYPWGRGPAAESCNCRESGFDHALPSGYFSPKGDSPYGIQDMAGNVWQWTRSLWGEKLRRPSYIYPYDQNDGREQIEAASNIRRVVRGGAFYYFDYCVRSPVRNAMFPGTRHTGGGVRFIISNTKWNII